MRTVMKSDMVAHVWAQQTQSEARNSTRSLFFDRETIYSYGSHFPIARFIKNKAGVSAVLFTTRGYSTTTSGHIHDVRRALRGHDITIFNVERPDHTPRELKASAEHSIREALTAAQNARAKAFEHYCRAEIVVEETNELFKFMGQRFRVRMPRVKPEVLEKWRTAHERHLDVLARQQAVRMARTAEERAWAEKTRLERRTAWLAGEPNCLFRTDWNEDTLLRVHGDNVETSLGAEIPVSHAKRIWPVILQHRTDGTTYVRNGHSHHVGQFAIDRIDPTGDIKAGCHFIKFDQIEKIAVVLGLIEHADHA
jgi:hypothetical protein